MLTSICEVIILYEHISSKIEILYKKYTEAHNMYTFHNHNMYEIYYLHSGTRRYIINNKIYDLKAGDIALIDKFNPHLTKKLHGDAHERFVMYLDDETINSLGENSDKFLGMMGNRLISIPETKRQRVNRLFSDMYKVSKDENIFSNQLLHNYTYELFALIYNIIYNREYEDAIEFYGKDIDSAITYIFNNYKEKITLEQVADIVNMNTSYFSRYFKKVTGVGFSKYLTTLRIKEASSLLENTDMYISEIAEKSGFDTLQHFCNTFKKIKGISANEYRKNKS